MEPITIDCLLPSGILIPLRCNPKLSLETIKSQVFDEARKYPLFNLLQDKSCYVFVGVNEDAEREELVDESKSYEDVRLFQDLLKIAEKKGNMEQKLVDAEIGVIIGKRLAEFANLGPEVVDFRKNMLKVCEEAVHDRSKGWKERLQHAFPADVEERDLPMHLTAKLLAGNRINVEILASTQGGAYHTATVQVSADAKPKDVIDAAFQKKSIRLSERPDSYCLKVCGRVEYLLRDTSLKHYKYIRQCLAKDVKPELSLQLNRELLDSLGHDTFFSPTESTTGGQVSAPPLPARGKSLWHIPKDKKLKVKVVTARNVNPGQIYRLRVRAGVYHGGESLSLIGDTKDSEKTMEPSWNEFLVFDILLRDLPRNARLCFVIYGVIEGKGGKSTKGKGSKVNKKRSNHVPLAWVNMNLFDYRGQLQTGQKTLYCWPVDGQLDDALNYIGTTVNNPTIATCPALDISIDVDTKSTGSILYPSHEEMYQRGYVLYTEAGSAPLTGPEYEEMQKIAEMDPLAELEDQDRELIWKARSFCLQIPHSLPKLAASAKWSNPDQVAEMHYMLSQWPPVKVETAMELLDYLYPDQVLRRFAVQCLEAQLQDSDLQRYLLQLVQVLKYESYLDCPLAEFLLKRALRNKLIGHYFYWNLKAEMHVPEVAVRFGLMLEAYCRGNGAHMKVLTSQIKAVQRFCELTTLLQQKQFKEKSRKQNALTAMRQKLQEPAVLESVTSISSPLNPVFRLGNYQLDKCKFMDSKMRPLWLVYENADPEMTSSPDKDKEGRYLFLIFKNGDDLRQDMLTLQVIGIMDNFWQEAGLDLKMTPYGCLAAGKQVGMIEVVLQADTVARIQKKHRGSRGAFDKKCLFQWLQEKNPDKESLDKAVEMFMLSCAGYCVATYVLGIGDRHSDNIMLKENGQLLHIDFGHFLGNFKSKFGVRRERVPFVLTHDFIYVITKGGDEKSPLFEKFKNLCETAFMELRNHGPFLISLFAMMLSTGIPELRSLDDITYVREALHLGYSSDEALQKFRRKFREAIDNSWSVSWNWWAHNVARNN